ncbi:unnamed protein product [Thelazia callipaeda]|uniref:Lipoprotein n=1 Tax=Thelazia callipaeda TaxID=103827 RepID=A0A0N5CZ99_THECL|nr:unnamed protein product [Thelazia callipaeda]
MQTIIRQKKIIEKLERQLKNCTHSKSDASSLSVRIDEQRAKFERRDGFSYNFVILDWKRNDQGKAQQHLNLALKQSASNVYVYDHGSLSGTFFSFGDRIIDIDGITFARAIDIRDRIIWSHHNKDYFTSIIERPITEQAMNIMSSFLNPSNSCFTVLLRV